MRPGAKFPVVVVDRVEAGLFPRDTRAPDPKGSRDLSYGAAASVLRWLPKGDAPSVFTYDPAGPSPFLADLTDEY